MAPINRTTLSEITKHFGSLRAANRLHGLNYERCAELPFVIDRLRPRFAEHLSYLDIGSGGESPLPTFLLRATNWDVQCIDKFEWVRRQETYAKRVIGEAALNGRFSVQVADLLTADLPEAAFDVITNISVIEHFAGTSDSDAMARSARLLKPGGTYILTTLMNDGFFREHFVQQDVYGEAFRTEPVFYQRHYDVAAVQQRLIAPSGLREVERVYFGDYGYQFFERVLQRRLPGPLKPLRALYKWATPHFARRFLSYSDRPVSRADMMTNTASGVILVLTNR
jgi:SAM-dependent methyltransferase